MQRLALDEADHKKFQAGWLEIHSTAPWSLTLTLWRVAAKKPGQLLKYDSGFDDLDIEPPCND